MVSWTQSQLTNADATLPVDSEKVFLESFSGGGGGETPL